MAQDDDEAAAALLQAAEDEAIRRMLGTAEFGRQDLRSNVQAQIEQSRRVVDGGRGRVAVAAGRRGGTRGGSDEDGDGDGRGSDDDEDEDEEDEFPTTHELVLTTHEKPVTSLSLDASGGRLASSSTDCTFKLHDLASMTATTLRAFKSVDPTETKDRTSSEAHPVHQVAFNPLAASQMLVITATPQARIFDRDGEELVSFVKGDMYLRDLNNTKGHISEVTSGAWHPTNKNFCVTAGTDSTLRIWDVNNKRSQKDVIVFKSKAPGAAGRTRMTAVAWGSQTQEGGSSLLVSAALDGSLVMYGGEGPYHRPVGEIRDAHTAGTWTSGLDISSDGRLVVSRGGDDTVKLWDTRKFNAPVSIGNYASTSSVYQTSNIRFSPSSANIILGSPTGDLHILNPATLRSELTTPITPGSPLISVLWYPKLNQILTSSANGAIHILYSPTLSTGGAKLILSRAPKRRHIDDDPSRTTNLDQTGFSGDAVILSGSGGTRDDSATSNPLSAAARHPTIGLTASGKSRDPRRPHLPAQTPFGRNAPSDAFLAANVPLSSMRDEDPREALLKYAAAAERDPIFTKAYAQTQPKTIYAATAGRGEEGDADEPDRKKAKR